MEGVHSQNQNQNQGLEMASVQVSESEKHVWKMYILLHDLDFFLVLPTLIASNFQVSFTVKELYTS